MKAYSLKKLISSLHQIVNGVVTCDAWSVIGTEPLSGENLNIVYIGNEAEKNYIVSQSFGNNYNEIYMGRKWLWEIYNIIRKKHNDCHLLFIEGSIIHRILYMKQNDYFIPLWVNGDVNIPLPVSNKSAKEDLRKIRKNKLRFEVTNEESQFHSFYHNMYVPYVTRRHEDRTCLRKYDHLIRDFKLGLSQLLFVKKGNEAIAGQVIGFQGNQPGLGCVGLKDGNPAHLKDGAMAAAFYFSSLYLQERGYKKMSLGGSRAFLKDGVLQYKKKWNLELVRRTTFNTTKLFIFKPGFIVKPLQLSQGLKGFFLRNPFIYVDKGHLYGAVFIENDELHSGINSEEYHRKYHLLGLSQLSFFSL